MFFLRNQLIKLDFIIRKIFQHHFIVLLTSQLIILLIVYFPILLINLLVFCHSWENEILVDLRLYKLVKNFFFKLSKFIFNFCVYVTLSAQRSTG
jgi:hypothetical protein